MMSIGPIHDVIFRHTPDCEAMTVSLIVRAIKSDSYREMENPEDQHYQSVSGRECAWYCIRSKPKHEHIAAKHLRRLKNLEVFNPRLRMRKVTRRGPAWVTEALFPNYLFARFPFHQMLDDVRFAQGVSSVVGFGGQYPEVPTEAIEDLRRNFPADDLKVADELPCEGDTITITIPAMFGWSGKVLRSLPARQRVQVLLEMLGRTAMVELSAKDVIVEGRAVRSGLVVQDCAA